VLGGLGLLNTSISIQRNLLFQEEYLVYRYNLFKLEPSMTILDLPILSRIRRNHGLEHATITILSQRLPYRALAGYSFPSGFFLLGDVSTDQVREAVVQALSRLNNGERTLAIHPNCGTNFISSGFVAGALAWLGMAGAKNNRDKVERLPLVLTLVVLGLILSQPLGPKIQEHITTSGDPLGMSVVDISPIRFGPLSLHRVITQG
jgi:hypothetical protein